MSWATVNARARGLAARLLPAGELAAARVAPEIERVARLVARRGFPLASGRPNAQRVEAALRAGSSAELATLGRWLGRREAAALGALLAAEDARSVRRLVRGVLAGVPLAERLAGTHATPALPAAALADLARRRSAAEIGALLTAWGNPLGTAVRAALAGAQPDLLRLELGLAAAVAAHLAAAARRGDAAVRRLAADTLDATHATTALLLAAEAASAPGGSAAEGGPAPGECFHGGGRVLGRERFLAAVASGGPRRAAALLAPSFGKGETAAVLASGETAGGRLERALLAEAHAAQRRLARSRPETAAPTLCWLLALRVETAALRGAAWAADLAGSVA